MATSNDGGGSARPRGQQSMLARHRSRDQSLPAPHAHRMAQEGTNPRTGNYFTLGYKDGFSQWWASLSPATAEHSVLSYIPRLQKPPVPSMSPGKSNGTSSAPVSASQSVETFPAHDAASSATTEVDPHGPRRWATDTVALSGRNRALNEFSVTRTAASEPEKPRHDLVMLHGYGAGLAFFYKNFEPLSRRPGWRLFALDLPGMGRSSRPPFRLRARDRPGRIDEAESWFVDALEEWRVTRRLDRFTLLGHSLGGYLAVAYALKYPGRLEKLILVSPVGIPEDPFAVASDLPEPGAAASSAVDDANVGAAPAPPADASPRDKNNFLNARGGADSDSDSAKQQPQRRPYPKWLIYLWDANISPFSFVRWAGPLGPRLVSGWTSRRFSHLPPREAQALHDYSYALFRQRGSGEYALAHILAPGAFARSPLIRRIGAVGRGWVRDAPTPMPGPSATTAVAGSTQVDGQQNGAPARSGEGAGAGEGRRENGIPVVFVYGEHDWMDKDGGRAAARKLEEATERAVKGTSAAEAARDGGSAKVLVVGKAGHHVYLDSPDEFNEVMAKEMEDVEKRAQR